MSPVSFCDSIGIIRCSNPFEVSDLLNKLPKRIFSGIGAATLIVPGLVALMGSTGGADEAKHKPKAGTKKESTKTAVKKKAAKGEDKGYTSPDWWKPGEKSKNENSKK